ncbi:MAG: hypothetical protein MUO97_03940 [Dehalococcoidia bacterium]|nr:hypothetical protein [Dehalococcoidia bacterium]
MRKKKKCFVIMPFSGTESCNEEKWKEIFDHIIKPAVEDCRLGYKCERSLPERENIIKGILRALSEADVVIADLTDGNPNVFYELGVRHTLTKRTILIAQGKEHIPFDLRPYPTVFYGESPTKIANFKSDIKRKLMDVSKNPERSDNPVADFLKDGQITIQQENQIVQEKIKPATSSSPTIMPAKEVDAKIPSGPMYGGFQRIVLCPICRIQARRDNLGELICPSCNARLCPKGHIFDDKICRFCGWEDTNYSLWQKVQRTRPKAVQPSIPPSASKLRRMCPYCGFINIANTRICPHCGKATDVILSGTEKTPVKEPPTLPKPIPPSASPMHTCPRCGSGMPYDYKKCLICGLQMDTKS